MTNTDRIGLIKSSSADSGIKETLIHLLEQDSKSPTSLRLKNSERGNVSANVEKGDVWITFTSIKDIKILAYTGVGNPNDKTNYQNLAGFEMDLDT